MYEMYRIVAQRNDDIAEFRVRGTSHTQHVWNKTRINDLAEPAARRIHDLKSSGYTVRVEIAGRLIGVENQ